MISKEGGVLFHFAHQDDEFACMNHLRFEVAISPESVFCVFATDGGGKGKLSKIRDQESLQALLSLGVLRENILFLGSLHGIPDGALVEHLIPLREIYLKTLNKRAWRRIYCPAWEGGHPDHDAVHILAQALARDFRCEDVWEFGIYHGMGTAWKFFHMLQPIRHSLEISCFYLSYAGIFRQVRLISYYRSQTSSWILFLPVVLLSLFVRRREVCQRVSSTRIENPPHGGMLLYERVFGFTFARFLVAQKAFSASLPGNPQAAKK